MHQRSKLLSIIYRLRIIIVFSSIVAVFFCIPILSHITKPFKIGGFDDPRSESAKAEKTIAEKLPYGGSRVFVLYKSKTLKANDHAFKDAVEKSLDGLKHFPHSHHVISPYDNSVQITDDEHGAYAVIELKSRAEESSNWVKDIETALDQPQNLTMLMGGEPVFIADTKELSQSDLFRAEKIAFPLAIIALLLVFRSVISALMPLIVGAVSITFIVVFLYFLGEHFEISVFVLNIATLLGLGLSLDYTLFIVSRFREEIAHGKTVFDALVHTYKSAGKAVLFSGITVLISMAALLYFPVNLLYSIGIGGVVVSFVSLLIAFIFLPALLSVIGTRINALPLSFLKLPHYHNPEQRLWFRMAMFIMRRPISIFTLTMIFLVMLGYPFAHVKINRPNVTILPTRIESRQLYDEFKRLYGANELTPIYVLAKSKHSSILTSKNIASLYNFVEKLKGDSEVKRVDAIVTFMKDFNKQQYQKLYGMPRDSFDPKLKQYLDQTTAKDFTLITIISKNRVNDAHTLALIKRIRNMNIKNGITIQVGGSSADIVDTIRSIYKLFFEAIAVISLVTYLVLLLLFRSLLLPLKAIIVNFFSLFVCYGMLVYIFQDGHFHKLLAFEPLGFTDMNLPILLFCGLFGLSMDYEVFLLARIREFYHLTGNNSLAVALGLERSGRIITYAALIMILVCSAFITAEIVFIKSFGLSVCLAVLVDATIIRSVLVPASMRLMGKWNWYLPKWMDRILPKMDLH